MENKKQGKGLVVALVMFIIICLGLIAYILYDKGIILEKEEVTKQETTEKKTEPVKEKELDINSRLVQELYNRVSYIEDNGTCNYGIYTNSDFYVENGSEEIKMQLVGRQLNNIGKLSISPESDDYQKIEKEIVNGNMHYYIATNPTAYSKKYVESIYKKLYGSDATLDKTVMIRMDKYNANLYIYNDKIDKYVLYQGEGGGTCGPLKNDVKISKASLNNNELKIYENVKVYAAQDYDDGTGKTIKSGELVEEDNYVYTFKQEEDGMYSFVSRTKEK